jgi:8-oxo-dGTP pyrophosphatase MutT (NUDIX family)
LGKDIITTKLVNSLEQTADEDVNAAVVVLLKKTSLGFEVLFVKRAESPKDAWSGQTALPGGKRDPKDFEIKTTVVRETLEETKIDLLVGCRFLGTMEPLRSVKKPEVKILPFVVLQEREQTIELNEELTEYFWMPLKELAEHEKIVTIDLKEVPTYTVNSHVIWGLTYNIIHNLVTLLSANEKS